MIAVRLGYIGVTTSGYTNAFSLTVSGAAIDSLLILPLLVQEPG